ncbi:MAG: DNA-binding protein [Bacteroidales bacterium]
MIYSDNAINILTAQTYKGIGRAWIVRNLKGRESIDTNTIVSLLKKETKEKYQKALQNLINEREKNELAEKRSAIEEGYNQTLEEIDCFEDKRQGIKEKLQKLDGFIDGVISIGDNNFPQYRGKVKDSEQPVVLFYRGNMDLLKSTNKNIAVIGLLNPDNDIESIEQDVVAELVKNGAVIVSGLALGCDSIAHRQTLHSNGKTIAILPCSLNNILPATNTELANEIVNNKGLLITEYYENVKSKMELSSRYQERDRLQALFSDSIILSASYAKNNLGHDSGSRLAMEYAFNYSIPRAVIYDSNTNVNNPKYDLSRQLIREDNKITIISKDNLVSTVKKILLSKPYIQNNQHFQPSLFD